MGNYALQNYLSALSTMQMSQHPNIGPFCTLQAIANWERFRLNFYFISCEKINEANYLSVDQCFLAEFQVKGVYPPIILLYSVYIKVMVFPILSHFLWKSSAEKLC